MTGRVYIGICYGNVRKSAMSHHNESHKTKTCYDTTHCTHDVVNFSAVSFFIVITSLWSKINYSVLSAITGSFFAATLDGNRPAISVRQTLIAMSITAALTGIEALIGTSVRCAIIMFIGIVSR